MKNKLSWTLILLSTLFTSLFLSDISSVYGEDSHSNNKVEVKVLEGYVSSDDSMRPVALSSNQNIPVFYNDAGKIYAITKITKATIGTHLKHLWFLRDQIILDATIPIKENQMKAVSGLILKPNWTGKWRIDITSDDGTLLYSIPFLIQKKPEVQQASSERSTPHQEENAGMNPISMAQPVTTP